MNTPISRIVTVSFLALLGAASIGALARADVTAAKTSSAKTSLAKESAPPVLAPVIPAPAKKAPAAAKSALVRNIELIEKKGGVIVRVHLNKKAEFTHQIEPAKDGKPYRIILDCQNAVHNIGANRFMTLPQTVIKSIRTSQFAVKPSNVCRIVLDLKKEAFYKVQAADKHIDLFVTDASVNPFDSWSAASFLADKKAKRLAAADLKKSKGSTATSNKQPKQSVTMAKSLTASLREMSKPPAKSVVKESVVKERVAKQSAVKKGIVKSDKQVIVASKKAASETKTARAKTTGKAAKNASKKTVTVAKSAPKAGTTSKKAAKKSIKSSVSKTKTPPVVASVSKKGPAKKQAAKKSSAKDSGARLAAAAKKSSRTKKSSTKSVSKVSKSSSSLFASSAQAAIKPSAVKKSNADKGYSAKFRRSVDKRAIKLKGTLVAEFPKRLTIKYKSRGTRDPFASLFDRRENKNNNMLDPRPNIESLTMVGVSRDVDGKTRGLFEDIDGRGYILTKGDRVEHGAVIKITSKKAYFQIFEYGWSRTVALSLEG